MTSESETQSAPATQRSAAKTARAIVAALVLGALGSGLWEVALREPFFAVGNWTLSLISHFWSGYLDVLHRDVGKLYTDYLVVPIFALVVSGFIAGLISITSFLHRRVSRLREDIAAKEEPAVSVEDMLQRVARLENVIRYGLWPLVAAYALMYALVAWQTSYMRSASNWAER